MLFFCRLGPVTTRWSYSSFSHSWRPTTYRTDELQIHLKVHAPRGKSVKDGVCRLSEFFKTRVCGATGSTCVTCISFHLMLKVIKKKKKEEYSFGYYFGEKKGILAHTKIDSGSLARRTVDVCLALGPVY